MTRFQTIINMMSSFSFPVEFDHVKIGTRVPFGTYTYEIPNVGADNAVYVPMYQFELRVYVEKLDAKIDKEIADAFKLNEITWTRDAPIYMSDSNAYEIGYHFGIISEE